MMESIFGDEFQLSDRTAQQEKIFVAVRLRPLNGKEVAKGDVSDWECINTTTIVFKNNPSERQTYPNMYTFDRVYGCDSSTKQVYEEGVKRIAISVLNGINSTIFAYGQTSSGKTYTMSGITEYAIADIYDYISRQNDREFALRFSAIEIYNECVRDLLNQDGPPLRLLDDPEKGTVVEKLTEADVKDCNHLKELIYVCEVERQIGETALNETSSRSHQILRLTVESSTHEYKRVDSGRTFAATVNFVDLAGSERASQTLAAGTRLKEGCHINRSLLTLGTVIRKLSKGGNGHIPYRNSKLTRILQNSLGGNARTAILCTICPAHTHVEQTRNTLLFASCAKDVTTNAQVNVVISDKTLVKQLQQELARLENELRMMSPASNDSTSSIRDMKFQIEKMGKEIEELAQQRDLAESRLEHLIRVTGIDPYSLPWGELCHLNEKGSRNGYEGDSLSTSRLTDIEGSNNGYGGDSLSVSHLDDIEFSDIKNKDQQFLHEDSHMKFLGKYSMSDTSLEFTVNPEGSYKEDQSIETKTSNIDDNNIIKSLDNGSNEHDQLIEEISSIGDNNKITIYNENNYNKEDQNIKKMSNIDSNIATEEAEIYDNYDCLKEKTQDIQTKIERSPCSSDIDISDSEGICFTRRNSCKEFTSNASSEKEMMTASTNDNESKYEKPEDHAQVIPTSKSEEDVKTITQQYSGTQEVPQKIKSSPEGDVSSELANSDPKALPTDELVKEINAEANESEQLNNQMIAPDKDWPTVFEKQRREIIKLWDECNTPLIHRSYFFLLFNGDQYDFVYMEVELRRLSFLKNTSPRATSARALSRERIMLSKKLLKKFTSTQRDALFKKWGIPLDSKHRRVRLSRSVWTNTNDIDHIKESAKIVAKLVGIVELSQTPKEVFGLSFLPKSDHFKTSFWNTTMSFT